jgi:hypothetical protein
MSWATVLFQQAEKPATKMWPDNKLPLRPSFNTSRCSPFNIAHFSISQESVMDSIHFPVLSGGKDATPSDPQEA